MNRNISTSDLEVKNLPILSDEDAKEKYNKGWSFSYVYSLKGLRDIYLISFKAKEKSLGSIFKLLSSQKGSDYINWEKRKVLEYLNALVNFKLLDNNYESESRVFKQKCFNSELSESEKKVFKKIFFDYFRFKEISTWFISPTGELHSEYETLSEKDYINQSKLLYYFSDTNRFTDSFLTNLERVCSKYIIDDKMSHLMRFWDVYLKWGITLGVLDKFNLHRLDIFVDGNKELSVAYFILPFNEFNLLDFCQEKFKSRHIRIPELIFEIVKEFRFAVNDIKDYIISEIKRNDQITYERTSEIFLIKGKTSEKNTKEATYLYPIINDTYVSHLIIRK